MNRRGRLTSSSVLRLFYRGVSMALFVPDYMYPTVYDIPSDLFRKLYTKIVFLDIDNTLVPYENPVPTEENRLWLRSLIQRGIEPIFLSNNHEPRVKEYALKTDCAYYFDVGKPSCRVHRKIMNERGVSPQNCLAIGDQILTDVLAAHLAGCKAILVEPIKDLDTVFVKSKRWIEKPFIRCYKKRKGL